MIGKLIIIGIIIATLVILVPNSSKLFQSVPSLDTVKDKIDQATSDRGVINASKSVIKEISMGRKLVDANSTDQTDTVSSNTQASVYQLAPQYVTRQNFTGQVFEKSGNTCQISIPNLAQTINGKKQLTGIVQLDQCPEKVGDPVQVVQLIAKPNSPAVNVTSGLVVTPYSNSGTTSSGTTTNTAPNTQALPTLPSYYNTIQLTATNQGNNAILNFDDSSGQTKSVIVTMKNSDIILFTGTFYSSKFTAEIKDVPNTPHIIEMTIDNTVYGILHASVYAPSNMQNSTITGILSK